ncbi:MAG: type IX secretion system protein PorQ [Bacteroidota bacterium]
MLQFHFRAWWTDAFKSLSFFCMLLLLITSAHGQIGGQNTFDFLNLTPSARLNAIGGMNVSIFDEDVSMAYMNPALTNDSMDGQLFLSYSPFLAGIQFGYTGYGKTFEGIGDFHAGIKYFNSGSQVQADPFGNVTGSFSSSEAVLTVGGSRTVINNQFRYGLNVKYIFSNLAPGFSSSGLALDLGGSYVSKNRLFSAGLVLKNMGTQLNTYTGAGNTEPLPFQIVAGISNKLKYMPLRFSITLIQLENPNLIYDNPNAEVQLDLNGEPIEQGSPLPDQIFRHVVFGGEFLLGKGFRLRGGYNHMRRQELRSQNRAGLSGFSMGVGIRSERRNFGFDYGFSSFGAGSIFTAHQFSLRIGLNSKTPKPTPDINS